MLSEEYFSSIHQRTYALRTHLNSIVRKIRAQSGFENFLTQANLGNITASVNSVRPIIYLLSIPCGSLALIVYKAEQSTGKTIQIAPIWLNSITEESIRDILVGLGDKLEGWFAAYDEQVESPAEWFEEVDRVTHDMWKPSGPYGAYC